MPVSDWSVGMKVVVLRYNINNAADRVLHTTITKVGRTLVTTASKHVFDVGGNYPVGKESSNGYGTHLRTVRQHEEETYVGKVREALHELTSPRGKTLTLDVYAALGEVLGVTAPAGMVSPVADILRMADALAGWVSSEGIDDELVEQYNTARNALAKKGLYAENNNAASSHDDSLR